QAGQRRREKRRRINHRRQKRGKRDDGGGTGREAGRAESGLGSAPGRKKNKKSVSGEASPWSAGERNYRHRSGTGDSCGVLRKKGAGPPGDYRSSSGGDRLGGAADDRNGG